MLEGKPSFGWRGRVLLGVMMATLLLVRVDTLRLTPVRALASTYLFSVEQWEVTHFMSKWVHLLWETLPSKKPSRERRLATLQEYLVIAKRVEKEKDRLEGPNLGRGTTLGSPGAVSKSVAADSKDYLKELLTARDKLRPEAEEGIEAELSAVLHAVGLGSRWSFLFPPVDLRFAQRPTILIVSYRDRIQLTEAILLRPELPPLERDRLEREILERYNLVALVDDLAGLATYPSVVPDSYPLRFVLQTAAHEWLHQYFFFRPLGQNLRSSFDMVTLNETAADLAGREIGDMAFAAMGGDLTAASTQYLSEEERYPFFTQEMRKTRLRVEELLAQGKIAEAERYMKERWWFLTLRGYPVRKLNQAYFAFRGSYAESAASVSPIGEQLKELRRLLPDVGAFIKAISQVSSYQEFLTLLEEAKTEAGDKATDGLPALP